MSINNLQRARTSATMSGMRTRSQAGFIDVMLIGLVGCGILLLGAIVFAGWAYSGYQDYKKNSNVKSAAAAAASKEQTQKEDAAQYAEESKNPLKTHVGPDIYGSVTVQYPKTWSGYVNEQVGGSGVPMNDYFHPDVVNNTQNQNNAYALRVQITNTTYSATMQQFQALAKTGKVQVTPYKLPKVPSVVGSRIDGQITAAKQGSMIVLPLRNVTLQVSTEASDYEADFDNIILPNLTFAP